MIINGKLVSGISNLDGDARSKLLSDLILLEELLSENESRFRENQDYYREIITTLKQTFFDFEGLEIKLSESEAQRLEAQRKFRTRIIIISCVVILLLALIVMLITFSNKLQKQKKKLVAANDEIKRINENLEAIVRERTRSLEEAHRELDTFLYRASHDLRSPVRSIIGLCSIESHLSQHELAQKVEVISVGMDKLLKKLSLISEINQPTNYSSITLRDVVERVRELFAAEIRTQQIQLNFDCPPDIVFQSYPSLVESILVNIVENALFFSAMNNTTQACIEFHAGIKDRHVEFSVSDNGVGIEAAIRERLFEMFFRGHEKSTGSGLGLYIVNKSVQVLGGKIAVDSEPGKFTRFVVQLPLDNMPESKRLKAA
jgi:signal transduction histidine kinase